jgi:hypothetical protein
MLRTNRVQLLWLLAGISVLAPFLYLGWHGIAASDDYIDYKFLQEFGFWGALKNYYLNWSGRYVSYTLVFLLNPLHLGEQLGPAILNTIALGMLISMAYFQAKILCKIFPTKNQLIPIAVLISCFWLMYIPHPVELLFWFTGTWAYLPGLLGISAWVVLHLTERSKIQNVFYFILPFLIGGSSEMNVILMAFVFALYFPQNKSNWKPYFIAMLLFAVAASFELLSPGSQVRMSYFETTAQNPVADFSFSIKHSLSITWHHVRDWSRSSPVLAIALLLAFLLNVNEKPISKLPIWLMFLGGFMMIPVLYFPFFWGTGNEVPPQRINNVIFIYFSLLVFFFTPLVLRRLLIKTQIPNVLVLIASIGIFWIASYQSRLRTALFDIKELPEFTKEIRIREELTNSHFTNHSSDTLVLPPIKHIPYTIFYGDLKSDPTHWYNEGYAYYHGIAAVVCDSVEVK